MPPAFLAAGGTGEAPAPSIDFLALLGGVLRHWKLVVGAVILMLAASYGALRLMPTLFQSDAEILVFDPESQIDDKVQTPISPFRSIADNAAMNTEIEVLKSESVALRVAKELELDRDPEFQPKSRIVAAAQRLGLASVSSSATPGQSAAAAADQRTQNLDRAAEMLLQRLKVQQVPFSYILTISMSSQDPVKAQRLTETIANDFLAIQREERQEALRRATVWLKGRVDDLQSRTLETEAAIEKLKTESGLSDTDALSQNLKDQQIAELNTQLMKARGDVADKRAHLDAARAAESNGHIGDIPELTASGVMAQLRQRQSELSLREAQLRARLGPNHGEVIALGMQLADINRQLGEEAEHIVGNLKEAYDVALRQEQSLEGNLRRLTAPQGDTAVTQKLRELRRVADTDRKLYESYLTQYNEASQRLTLQEVTARIITPATLPDSPSSPRRLLFYALGVILGVGGGVGLALLLELLKPGLKTGAQVEKNLGYPVIGAIPAVDKRELRRVRDDGMARLLLDTPLSQLSEAVHSLRIGLEISAPDHAAKVILVTSSLPAEGKSTAATLLAASGAMSGRKTILLDCDLRHQSVSTALGRQQPGLSELLTGAANLAEVTVQHPTMDIDVIPAGSITRSPADLLMSPMMRALIEKLRERYHYIVLDGSPLLAVADASALATLVDKILIVVEWSRTSQASILDAFKLLRFERERIAGIVLNKVDLKQMHGYQYGAGSGYHYRAIGKYFSDAKL
jgi:succinoglycan biosynthesis transport protein ExoP